MRRQYFTWAWLTLSIVLTIYGGYSLIYNNVKGKELSVLGLIFFIVGAILLLLYLILLLISYYQKKNNNSDKKEIPSTKEEEITKPQDIKIEAKPVNINKEASPQTITRKSDVPYVSSRSSYTRSDEGGSGYVKKVGYGPVLRISNNEILDMRNNTYYRIEGRIVNMSGSGPVYEISNNRIKLAFGGYLYEINGSNVNKIYGGFYASLSGGYLQLYDLKERYEIPSDLTLKQKLAVVALLFGDY